jgi:rare lipoprotein A
LKHLHTGKHGRLVRNAILTGALAGVLATAQDVRPSSAHPHAAHAYPARVHSAHIQHGSDRSFHDKIVGNAGAARVGGSFSGAGLASVYSGGRTASGEHMSAGGMTAAHRTLAFGTSVTVVNNRNGRAVVVKINDRGPFVRGRIIDLSPAAARAIGISGLAPVSLTVGHGG